MPILYIGVGLLLMLMSHDSKHFIGKRAYFGYVCAFGILLIGVLDLAR